MADDAAVAIALGLPDEDPPEGFVFPVVDKPFAGLPEEAGDGLFVEDAITKGDINANAESARGKLYFLLGETLTYYANDDLDELKDQFVNTLYKCNGANNNFIEEGDAVLKLNTANGTTVYCKKQDINAIVLDGDSRNNVYGFIPTDVRLGFTLSKQYLINKNPNSTFGQQYNQDLTEFYSEPVQQYLIAITNYEQQVEEGVEGLEPVRPVDVHGRELIIEEPEGAGVSADHCAAERNDFIQHVCKIRITEEAGGAEGAVAVEAGAAEAEAEAEAGGGGGGGGAVAAARAGGGDEDRKEGEAGDEAAVAAVPEGPLRVIEDQITEIETIVTELYEIITDPDNPAQAAAVQPRKEDAKLQYNAINGFLLPTVIDNIQTYIQANPLNNRRKVQDFLDRLQRNYFRLSLTIPVPNSIIRAVFGAEAGIIPTPVIPLFPEAEEIGTGGGGGGAPPEEEGGAAAATDQAAALEEIGNSITLIEEIKRSLLNNIVNPEDQAQLLPPAALEIHRDQINIQYNIISILFLPSVIEKIQAIQNPAANREDIQEFQNRLLAVYNDLSLEVENPNEFVPAAFPENMRGIVRPPQIPDFLNPAVVDPAAAMDAELVKIDEVITMIGEMKRSLFAIITDPESGEVVSADQLEIHRNRINAMYNAINQYFLPNVIERLNAIPVTDANRDRIEGFQTRLVSVYNDLKVDGGDVVDNEHVAAAFPATMIELIRPPPIPDFVNAVPPDLDIIGNRIDQIQEMRVRLTGFISDPVELAAHRDDANGTYNSINKNLLPPVIAALQGIEVTDANRDRILGFQTRLNELYASLKVDGGLNGMVDNVEVAAAFPADMDGLTRPPPIPVFVVPGDPAAVVGGGGGGDPLVAFAGAGAGGGDDALVAFAGAGAGADPLVVGVGGDPLGAVVSLDSINAEIINIIARKNELWAIIAMEDRREEALGIYNEINGVLLPAVIAHFRTAVLRPDKSVEDKKKLLIFLKAIQKLIDILNYSLEVHLAFPDDMEGVIRPPELMRNRNLEDAHRNAIPDEEDREAALARIRGAGAGPPVTATVALVTSAGAHGGGTGRWLDYFAGFLRAPAAGGTGGGGTGGGGGGGILGFLGGLVAVPPPGGGGGGTGGGAPAPPPHLPAAAANMLNHVANEAGPIANAAGNGINPAILARPGLPDPPPEAFDLDPDDAF